MNGRAMRQRREIARQLCCASFLIAAVLPTAVAAQAAESGGRVSLHAFAGPNSGGWSKTEPSTAPGGAPVSFEFGSGAGAGLRVAYAITPSVALWAAGDLNVEAEGPFMGLYGGLAGRMVPAPRIGLEGRLGVGRLDDGTFGVVGASLSWFFARALSLGLAAEVLTPIGTGRRHNGLQNVDVDYDGGPARLRLELGWHPGR